jgi:hypothetical protein
MKDNKNEYRSDRERDDRDERDIDQDKLRDNTMNETIREVQGDPDTNLNELREDNREFDDDDHIRLRNARDTDQTQGVSYNPNDASGVRSGGISDMDDQTAGGAGLNTGVTKGIGSHLSTKKGISGSDFDGQNATS